MQIPGAMPAKQTHLLRPSERRESGGIGFEPKSPFDVLTSGVLLKLSPVIAELIAPQIEIQEKTRRSHL